MQLLLSKMSLVVVSGILSPNQIVLLRSYTLSSFLPPPLPNYTLWQGIYTFSPCITGDKAHASFISRMCLGPAVRFYAQPRNERVDAPVRSVRHSLLLSAFGTSLGIRADSASHQRQPCAHRGNQRGLGEVFNQGSLFRGGRPEVYQSVGDPGKGEERFVPGCWRPISGDSLV